VGREVDVNTAVSAPNNSDVAVPTAGAPSVAFETMTFSELCARVKEDWIAHGRDWTRPGFRAVAAHRFGNWRMNIRSKVLRFPFSLLYRRMYRRCRNIYGIELDYTVHVGRRVVFEHQGAVVIHGNSWIGDECTIRQGVTLGIRTKDRPFDAPRLGTGVDVGAGAKLLGEIQIGDGARIGANAVVLCDVPAGATAVGIPARVLPEKPSGRPAAGEL
jgi:serine O-acetyltransferase